MATCAGGLNTWSLFCLGVQVVWLLMINSTFVNADLVKGDDLSLQRVTYSYKAKEKDLEFSEPDGLSCI